MMKLPPSLQGDSLTRLLQGIAIGAVATMVIGFYWGGWTLGSAAAKIADQRSQAAVVAALAPGCAERFRALPDANVRQIALTKADSWKRGDEFPRELVTLQGESSPDSALVDACSKLLLAEKATVPK